jgi:hypothetical protein
LGGAGDLHGFGYCLLGGGLSLFAFGHRSLSIDYVGDIIPNSYII